MKPKAVIFDLDGTLLDTVPGLSKAMNEILIKYHFPIHTIDEYKSYIGNGIKALVEQSVPEVSDTQLLEKMYKEKSLLYNEYWKDGTHLFPGISDMLTALTNKKITLAIFSNKEDYFTQQIVSHFLHEWPFLSVTGRTDSIPKKPDPSGIHVIMSKASFTPDEWVCVGDKDADIESASNAGVRSFWVSWGYQKTPPQNATIIHSPDELIASF